MVDRNKEEDKSPRQANNLTELDPRDEIDPATDPDPLTDTRTVAQTPTEEKFLIPLPADEKGNRAGVYDTTTGAAHPTAD
jgi:hypothetical protein